MKKIKPTLIRGITVLPHDENLNSTTDKKKIAAIAMNKKAYNELILVMQGELAFEVVEDLTTDELPNGDARLAWNNLKKKYEPNTAQTLIRLKKEFAGSRL